MYTKSDTTLNPLWAGFLDMVKGIFAVEISFYLFYNLVMAG